MAWKRLNRIFFKKEGSGDDWRRDEENLWDKELNVVAASDSRVKRQYLFLYPTK